MNRMIALALISMLIAGFDGKVAADSVAAGQLKTQLTQIQSFSARFKQVVYGSSAQELQSSSGSISVERPLKFKWQISDPYPQLIVTSGSRLYIYDPDLEQVQIRETTNALKGTPALLLAGDPEDVGKLFEVVLMAQLPDDPVETTVFSLSPRQTDSLFAEIKFFFHNNVPNSIEIRDALGQLTRVEFFQQTLNHKFPASEFEFDIPVGIDVLGNAEIPAS